MLLSECLRDMVKKELLSKKEAIFLMREIRNDVNNAVDNGVIFKIPNIFKFGYKNQLLSSQKIDKHLKEWFKTHDPLVGESRKKYLARAYRETNIHQGRRFADINFKGFPKDDTD